VPRAVLRRVALARRGAADRARGLEGVGRTDGARARAALVHVTHPGRCAAHRPGVPRRVLAGVAAAVALIECARVAVGGARRPPRCLRVGRAVGSVPRAVLGGIALARRGTALRARGREAIDRTGRARARARFRHVAHAGRRAALRPRIARGVLAGGARPVALVRRAWIGVGCAGRALRPLGIGRAARSVPRAGLREVAVARRRTADGARGEEGVGRTAAARPGAGLGHVAAASRGATYRARRLEGAGRGAARRARPVGAAFVALLHVRLDLAVPADGDRADVDERAPTLRGGPRDRVVGAVAGVVVVVVPAETRSDVQDPVAVVVFADN